ncbi:MAG: hypothetical protein JW895_01560 [Thermoleophilaceae bacterium]|nr:hypothetical protein [Thermoleophilaceae bacterium]
MSAGERRIPLGPLVGTLGSALLAVSLFLDWWDGVTAFTAFEVLDLVLLALAAGTAAALLADAGVAALRSPLSGRALPLAAAALLLVLVQVVNDPPLVLGTSGPDQTTGIWLALGGAVLMTLGAVVTGSRVSLAVDVRRREPTTRRDEQP